MLGKRSKIYIVVGTSKDIVFTHLSKVCKTNSRWLNAHVTSLGSGQEGDFLRMHRVSG